MDDRSVFQLYQLLLFPLEGLFVEPNGLKKRIFREILAHNTHFPPEFPSFTEPNRSYTGLPLEIETDLHIKSRQTSVLGIYNSY